MNTETKQTVYVKVKDMAGTDFVCPLHELRDPQSISETELENCVEEVVIGRYAGEMSVINN